MKNIFLVIVLVALLSGAAYAQLNKGTVSLSGSFGYARSTIKGTQTGKSSEFTIHPSIGYFFADRFEGYLFGAYASSSRTENGAKVTGDGFGGGLGANKYFKLADKLSFFTGPEFSFRKLNNYDSSTTNQFNASWGGGLLLLAHKHIGVTTRVGFLGYSSSSTKIPNVAQKQVVNDFGFMTNTNQLTFGLSYYF